MLRFKEQLDMEKPLRFLDISHEDDLLIRSYPFLTRSQRIDREARGMDRYQNIVSNGETPAEFPARPNLDFTKGL